MYLKTKTKILSTLRFIQEQTHKPLDIKLDKDDLIQEYFELCFLRLYSTSTGILPLFELLDNSPSIYYSIGLIIRPIMLDILSVQYIMKQRWKLRSNEAQIEEIVRVCEGYIFDGLKQIWLQQKTDLEFNVATQDDIDYFNSVIAVKYPNQLVKDENGQYNFIGKTKAGQAYYLYTSFRDSDPEEKKYISRVYAQYNFFSKLEHLSRLTYSVAGVNKEFQIQEIESAVFHLLYHLLTIFNFFSDYNVDLQRNFKLTLEKMDEYNKQGYYK